MNTPNTQVSDVTSTGRGKAVLDKLCALQDSHRLAIHIVEHKDHQFDVDKKTLDEMHAVPAHQLAESLKSLKEKLFSMSLLPSDASRMSMRPYEVQGILTSKKK